MRINIAYVILVAAVVVINFGQLETWQRAVSFGAFVLAAIVLFAVHA